MRLLQVKYHALKGTAMNFTWTPATGNDVADIVAMAQQHFQTEIDTIFNPDPVAYSRNITFAVINQFYLPGTDLLSVCRDENNRLLAYTWAKSNDRAPWSDDPMVVVRMAHVALDLSSKTRLRLILDMLELWENFAQFSKMPIICSTTMRREQDAFLKLHARVGYDIRGSYAYKRITLK
jgi:hypothetical protein